MSACALKWSHFEHKRIFNVTHTRLTIRIILNSMPFNVSFFVISKFIVCEEANFCNEQFLIANEIDCTKKVQSDMDSLINC